jgi:hypothetical protein
MVKANVVEEVELPVSMYTGQKKWFQVSFSIQTSN